MTDTTATTDSAEPDAERFPRPRIRTGAVLWGLLLVAVSSAILWTAVDPDRRDAAAAAVTALDGFGWTIVAVVTAGVILTLTALAAVIRAGQRRLAARER